MQVNKLSRPRYIEDLLITAEGDFKKTIADAVSNDRVVELILENGDSVHFYKDRNVNCVYIDGYEFTHCMSRYLANLEELLAE